MNNKRNEITPTSPIKMAFYAACHARKIITALTQVLLRPVSRRKTKARKNSVGEMRGRNTLRGRFTKTLNREAYLFAAVDEA